MSNGDNEGTVTFIINKQLTGCGSSKLDGAIRINRDKNDQFMVSMDWHKLDTIKEWLLKLEPEDYYEGPDPNEMPGLNPVWKFGKRIEGHLCYIKVFLIPVNNVYCVSFHFAEHDMVLPLKKTIETI